jgi:hypothetical protein
MQDPTLVLRDIHPATAPAWWPPAPGWWMLAALLIAVVVIYAVWQRRKRDRWRRIAGLFDGAIDSASDAPAQVAAMSELLRRAAHRRNSLADKLEGEAWLAYLDEGDTQRRFAQGAGRLLLEGGFRRDVDPQQVAALRILARERFIAWMVK